MSHSCTLILTHTNERSMCPAVCLLYAGHLSYSSPLSIYKSRLLPSSLPSSSPSSPSPPHSSSGSCFTWLHHSLLSLWCACETCIRPRPQQLLTRPGPYPSIPRHSPPPKKTTHTSLHSTAVSVHPPKRPKATLTRRRGARAPCTPAACRRRAACGSRRPGGGGTAPAGGVGGLVGWWVGETTRRRRESRQAATCHPSYGPVMLPPSHLSLTWLSATCLATRAPPASPPR